MKKRGDTRSHKKGQVTIFVILAIVIVAAVVGFFYFKSDIVKESVPESIEPVKTRLMQCLEDSVESGIYFAESNGGHIENPEFVPGNRYNPSSSHLSFGGLEIPYWSYLSSSSLPKEQILSLDLIQDQLEDFVDMKIKNCNFDEFRDAGYSIIIGEPNTNIEISDKFVDVEMSMDFSIEKGSDVSVINTHELRVNSNFGLLIEEATNIYEKQKEEMFLENYGIDVLRLYLPVDGVELTCSPMTWEVQKLYSDLTEALEVNHLAMTNQGEDEDYFVLDLPSNVETRFFYSSDWPTYFEVNPADGEMLISNPTGNERGMGILGFCYVPYHYVYNVKYPVLVQVSKDGETFQFPVVSIIEGNLPREARKGDNFVTEEVDVCEYKNTELTINVYDSDLNPVDGRVSFECFGSHCDMGGTRNGEIVANFPQCANGIIQVKADGYKDEEVIYSTVDSGNIVVVLDKEYRKGIELDFDGKYNGKAIVTFSNDDYYTSVVYPERKSVVLAQGTYDVSVSLYSDSEITIPASQREQCYDVPRSGLLGMAGLTTNECTTVQIPEQKLSSALIGGGTGEVYFSEADLEMSDKIMISGNKLNTPTSLEKLQENYVLVETETVEVSLI